MSITVDKNLCIGCGSCAAVCPQSFKMNDDEGKADVVSQESDCAHNAVESCPVQAIKIA